MNYLPCTLTERIDKDVRIVLLIVLSFSLPLSTFSQKKLLDNNSYKNWIRINFLESGITNNGKFIHSTYGSEAGGNCLVIKDVASKYTRTIYGGRNCIFTEDNSNAIFQVSDSLGILNLKSKKIKYILHVSNYGVPKEGTGRWMAYSWAGKEKKVVLKDLFSGEERIYAEANAYYFNDRGTILIVQFPDFLISINLESLIEKKINVKNIVSNIALDTSGKQLAFICKVNDDYVLSYFSNEIAYVRTQVSNNTFGIKDGFEIANYPINFSLDGKIIQFALGRKLDRPKKRDSFVITDKVSIWNYKDEYLLPEQNFRYNESLAKKYKAITQVSQINSCLQLEDIDTLLVYNENENTQYELLTNVKPRNNLLQKKELNSLILLSKIDGSRRVILNNPTYLTYNYMLSPESNFVIWFNDSLKNWQSYEIRTGKIKNITEYLGVSTYDDESEKLDTRVAFGIAGWLSEDSSLLIYDRYDIWEIDPKGLKKPLNITNAFGRRNKLIFRQAWRSKGLRVTSDTLLLAVFNRDNKNNGFAKTVLKKEGDPEMGTIDASVYYFMNTSPSNNTSISILTRPVKAKTSSVYLIQKMSVNDAPNLYITKDFKKYIRITDVQPQKEYNWMFSKLIHWRLPDGKIASGILYLPENFDSTKKYPIIFHYYEKRSDELNVFRMPGVNISEINIPWYVSNGYLVCIPDIYYIPGQTGPSVVNSVVSAATYLTQYSWVDKERMGLQGHSFGGYETNYLISHSDIFAAAQEGAGTSNLISGYGAISRSTGASRQLLYEYAQGNLRTTPWKDPNVYVNNSPIFNADKIKTPLLIMHNDEDGAVPFAQALELFNALHRLEKKVWLIQYDGAGHNSVNPEFGLDFSIRQQQFFDHYLKDKTAPKWMTQGIPIQEKGLTSGLELDSHNIEP